MAYKKAELIKKSLQAIEENNITRISHLFGYVEFSSATFYNHELEKLESIKNAIEKRRIVTKVDLINKWIKSKSPALSTLDKSAFTVYGLTEGTTSTTTG